jgi:hypothetical protein
MNIPVSMAVWLYLRAGQKVPRDLPETIFWSLVVEKVLILSIEKSPVKSEGEILFVRPGSAFNSTLSSIESVFRMPFQTRIADRLKFKNYYPQVIRFLKNAKEVERKFIWVELKEKGMLRHSLLDRLIGRKKVYLSPDEYAIYYDVKMKEAMKYKALYLSHISDIQFDID